MTEAQFGSLDIDSEPGVGTEVTVHLPQNENTTLVLSRLKSLERCLERMVESRREGAMALIKRPAGGGLWSQTLDGLAATPVVNPACDDEKSAAMALWTLSEEYAVLLASDKDGIESLMANNGTETIGIGICRVPADGTRVAQLLKQVFYSLKVPSAITKT